MHADLVRFRNFLAPPPGGESRPKRMRAAPASIGIPRRKPASNLALGYPKALRQLAEQQCFFDRGEGPVLRACQHTQKGFRQVTQPPLNKRSIAAEPAKRRDPAIAVDEHQPLAVLCLRRVPDRRVRWSGPASPRLALR
jgi:hypothetical protein